eukprot:403341248
MISNHSCQSCGRIFNSKTRKPIILPCNDTLCQECVETKILKQRETLPNQKNMVCCFSIFHTFEKIELNKVNNYVLDVFTKTELLTVVCDEHQDYFIQYHCQTCDSNMCEECFPIHKNHSIVNKSKQMKLDFDNCFRDLNLNTKVIESLQDHKDKILSLRDNQILTNKDFKNSFQLLSSYLSMHGFKDEPIKKIEKTLYINSSSFQFSLGSQKSQKNNQSQSQVRSHKSLPLQRQEIKENQTQVSISSNIQSTKQVQPEQNKWEQKLQESSTQKNFRNMNPATSSQIDTTLKPLHKSNDAQYSQKDSNLSQNNFQNIPRINVQIDPSLDKGPAIQKSYVSAQTNIRNQLLYQRPQTQPVLEERKYVSSYTKMQNQAASQISSSIPSISVQNQNQVQSRSIQGRPSNIQQNQNQRQVAQRSSISFNSLVRPQRSDQGTQTKQSANIQKQVVDPFRYKRTIPALLQNEPRYKKFVELVDAEVFQTYESILDEYYENDDIETFKLIYQGTRDGFTARNLDNRLKHQKSPANITFILSNHGQVFGGFSMIKRTFPINETNIYDPDAFIFQLNKQEVMEVDEESSSKYKAVTHQSDYLCCFGRNQLKIPSNCNSQFNSCRSRLRRGVFSLPEQLDSSPGDINPGSGDQEEVQCTMDHVEFTQEEINLQRSFLAGAKNFTVEEIEVYEVIFSPPQL